MYEVFDSFCKVPTWDTLHALDRERFTSALEQVVRDLAFSPEAMGEYIRAHHAQPIWPKSKDRLEAVIRLLVEEARQAQTRCAFEQRSGRVH